ncbi:hypothetical protein AGMMS50256_02430 [Betaproteobacteria bacterium]|nr:hypothetical protein AGMMS50256_02430 [Betaproteobacteria bacterium]
MCFFPNTLQYSTLLSYCWNYRSVQTRFLRSFERSGLSRDPAKLAELDALQVQIDALKQLQTETAAELGALLPAIPDRAFKGDL